MKGSSSHLSKTETKFVNENMSIPMTYGFVITSSITSRNQSHQIKQHMNIYICMYIYIYMYINQVKEKEKIRSCTIPMHLSTSS